MDLSKARPLPLLVFFSQEDTVVDPDATEAFAAKWPGPPEAVAVPITGDPAHHTLAGDILSPQTTSEIAAQITRWIEALPAVAGPSTTGE